MAEPPTRDLVLSWEEDAVIWDHISSLVSPSDPPSSVYVTTRKRRVLKVGKALTWKQVLKAARDPAKADGVELLGGWCLELVWVPDGERGKAWIDGWKRG